MAINASSVWVKVWPCRPFSGAPSVQLSPTTIGDPVQLFRDLANCTSPERSASRSWSEELSSGIIAAIITSGIRKLNNESAVQGISASRNFLDLP